jgi:DNA-binding transcriptional regulator YiaG
MIVQMAKSKKSARAPKPARSASAGRSWTPAAIRELRRSLRYTQAAFAEKLGVARRTLQDWEHDKNPIPKTICILLDCLQKIEGV